MSGFNPSGRKEDISVKLRAQNMRNTKDTTLKLEQENRKMEERLRELKMAMNREREERERQGGGFWQRGQTGTLNAYATEVLSDKSNKQNKSSKKKAVKVLKDEPLDLPTRSGGPGSMKYIAQRNPASDSARDTRNKGSKCGQCEDRPASLTCVQCSENYCAGCFAAFHLKGALKRHRSIPLHATGPRQCMSPRPTPPVSSRTAALVSGGSSSGDVFFQADRYGPQVSGGSGSGGSSEGASPASGQGLLDGAYNEADSAQYFQQALMAWRQGETTHDAAPKPRQAVIVTTDRSSVSTAEHSTSTGTAPVVPEVKSSAFSLSYAQRLLLKQHRRSEVGHMGGYGRPGSRDSMGTQSSGLTSVTPRLSSVGNEATYMEDDLDSEEERVSFQALYEAMTTPPQAATCRINDARVTVTDVTYLPREQRSGSAESSSYTVQEVSDLEAWKQDTQTREAGGDEGATSSKLKRLSKSRETTRVIEKRIPKSREVTHVLDRSSLTQVPDKGTNHSSRISNKELTQVLSSTTSSLVELPTVEEGETVENKNKPPPSAGAHRPKSSKSRPASGRHNAAKSRPASRAQSRAASRMGVEGTLTKMPSNSLQEIARRGPDNSAQYSSPLEGFFLAGVKVEDQVTGSRSRPVTPAHVEKLKVSNKLYAMSPRSWRPDGSHDATPREDGVAVVSPVMRYTYSGQLQGQSLEWNPVDSVGTPVPGESEESSAITPTPPDTGTGRPASKQRRRWDTPDSAPRPFSAQRASDGVAVTTSDAGQQKMRPSSSTGGTEPSKRLQRQLPTIDQDLDSDERARRKQQKGETDGWTSHHDDDDHTDPVIRQLSASRTRSWVASQNSLHPDSSRWETEVEAFILNSTDLDLEGADHQLSSRSTVVSRNKAREDTGRTSRAVVMDGDDLSKYDADSKTELQTQNTEDNETLDRLEWELASESGRITADGQISRLSHVDAEEDTRSSSSRSRSSSNTLRRSLDQGYDITSKLREDELSDGETDHRLHSSLDLADAEAVRALR